LCSVGALLTITSVGGLIFQGWSLTNGAVALLFGGGTVVLLGQCFSTISLNDAGMTIRNGLGHTDEIAWVDIDHLTPFSIPGSTLVGYAMRPGCAHPRNRLSALFSGASRPLPTKYGGYSTEELLAYLDEWRAWATRAA